MAKTVTSLDSLRLRIPASVSFPLLSPVQLCDSDQQFKYTPQLQIESQRKRVRQGVDGLWRVFFTQRLTRSVLTHVRSSSVHDPRKAYRPGGSNKRLIYRLSKAKTVHPLTKIPVLPPILTSRVEGFYSPRIQSPRLPISPRLRPLRSLRQLHSMW